MDTASQVVVNLNIFTLIRVDFLLLQLAWPFYAPPHVVLVIAAYEVAPELGWVRVGTLVVNLVVQNQCFSEEHWLGSFKSLRKDDRK